MTSRFEAGEHGQLVPVLAVVVVFVALVAAAVADVSRVASGRARAQTAADAAALAAVVALVGGDDPDSTARRLATANGASAVTRLDVETDALSAEVGVVVRVPTILLGMRDMTARARAGVDLDISQSG